MVFLSLSFHNFAKLSQVVVTLPPPLLQIHSIGIRNCLRFLSCVCVVHTVQVHLKPECEPYKSVLPRIHYICTSWLVEDEENSIAYSVLSMHTHGTHTHIRNQTSDIPAHTKSWTPRFETISPFIVIVHAYFCNCSVAFVLFVGVFASSSISNSERRVITENWTCFTTNTTRSLQLNTISTLRQKHERENNKYPSSGRYLPSQHNLAKKSKWSKTDTHGSGANRASDSSGGFREWTRRNVENSFRLKDIYTLRFF